MKALLRVDGGPSVGMGHLVRTHALGRALAGRGVSAIFATAAEDGERWLRSRGAEVVRIAVEPGASRDATATIRLAQEQDVDWVVTDGYVFREEYLQALAETAVPVASVDDLAGWYFPSALVISGGLGAAKLRYRTAPSTRLLVGAEYLLLRPEFGLPPTRIRSVVERVFVCFGGADPDDLTWQVLEAWRGLESPPALEVLVGAAYPHLDHLVPLAAKAHARIHRDLEGDAVADMMKACDLAIASAGMVAGELAALGVPSIVIVTSEDQRPNAAALAEEGAAVVLESTSCARVVQEARQLVVDVERRRELARSARRLVDGQGAHRAADAMMEVGR